MKVYMRWMTKQLLIHSCFWSILLCSAAGPVTHKLLMEAVSSRLIAIKGLVDAIGTILVTAAFNRWGDKIYRHMRAIAIGEILGYGALIVGVIAGTLSLTQYFVLETLAWVLLTNLLICSNNKVKRYLYAADEREKFDNNRSIAFSSACVIGNSIAMLSMPPAVAWSLFLLGIAIGNVFSVLAYNQARQVEQ